jgi:AcrR family transcriptional regulator
MYGDLVPRNTTERTAPEDGSRFPRRMVAAQRTRDALIAAAGELFAERGYGGTTVEAIAARAGVARPTVFTSVPGGKPELLKQARDRALAGDDEPVPVPERPWFRHAMAQTDPKELLRLQAGNYRRILDRAARLERALVVGATQHPELHELHRQARHQRHLGTLMVARRLADLNVLRPGLTDASAADTIYALAAPETYLLLVGDRNWSPDAYEQWLTEQLCRALLREPADAPT